MLLLDFIDLKKRLNRHEERKKTENSHFSIAKKNAKNDVIVST